MARFIVSAAAGNPATRFTEDLSVFQLLVAVSHNDTGAPVVGLKQNNFHHIQYLPAPWTFSVVDFSEDYPGLYSFTCEVHGPTPKIPFETIIAVRVEGPLLHIPPRRRDPLPDQGETLVKFRVEY